MLLVGTVRLLRRFLKKSHRTKAVDSVPVLFADDRTKLAWEIGQSVSQISATLPPESASLKAIPITFSPESASRGRYGILMAGTVIGTPQHDVYLVPERSLTILQRLQVPYRIAELKSAHTVLG